MSEVLYRKYRPKKFEDILGQDNVVKTLSSQIKLGTISHAYVFSGSRGTGKTSIARIFANELGISQNDIYEIDAASNNGVDNIREIIDSVSTLPFDSKYKIYILDEAHMLSKPASNALLKTLEEPPSYVIFILATTEIHKIPETILSRSEVYTFKKPSVDILSEVIKNTAKKEGFKIDGESVSLIALLGDGSFRDTLGNLQKVLSISKDKNISYDEVLMVTGAPKTELVNNLLSSVCKKDLDGALKVVQEVTKENIDIEVFIKLFLEKLRAVLLIRFGQIDFVKDSFGEDDFKMLSTLAKEKDIILNSNTIIRFLDAYTQTKDAFISHLPLELALIDILGQ